MRRQSGTLFLLPVLALVCCCWASSDVTTEGVSVSVLDFGAIPDDNQDDTQAIRKAIATCAGVKNVTLLFSPGRFDLSEPGEQGTYLVLDGADGVIVEGRGAAMVLHKPGTLFAVSDSLRVTFSDLTVDMDPLPFAGGRVVERGDGWFDMEVLPPHEIQEDQRVEAILSYDLENRRIGIGTDTYQLQFEGKTARIGDNRMRIRTEQAPPEVGTHVIVRYLVYGPNVFLVRDASDVRLNAITIFCAAGMGLYATNSEDLSLTDFRVMLPPDSQRWMTTTADATHFNNCRGTVLFENCLFEAMGDDATNIHQMYLKVMQRIDDHTVRLAFARPNWWAPSQAPRPGDQLEFGGQENPLSPIATAGVASVETDEASKEILIRLGVALPESVMPGSIVGNLSACPRVRIKGCVVRNNRARGFLIQTRDVVLENNRFEYCSAGAVHITCDADYWFEGMSTQNVLLRGNTFIGCNFWRGLHGAAVAVFADTKDHTPVAGIHKNIRFENNTFQEGNGPALFVSASEEVLIEGNAVEYSGYYGIILRDSRNVRITNNTVTDAEKLIHFDDSCAEVICDASPEPPSARGDG